MTSGMVIVIAVQVIIFFVVIVIIMVIGWELVWFPVGVCYKIPPYSHNGGILSWWEW